MAVSPYIDIPIQECGEPLVDIAAYSISCDPQYYNQGLSNSDAIFVRKGIAEKLSRVQQKIGHLRLLIWDGYRSRDTQSALYQRCWNEVKIKNPLWNEDKLQKEVGKFVSPATDPKRIPPHTTGGAVDLTLTDQHGNLLNMGTEFDDFSPKASLYSSEITDEAKSNRKILLEAMESEEFVVYPDEWWHFSYGDQLSAYLRGRGIAIYGEVNFTSHMS